MPENNNNNNNNYAKPEIIDFHTHAFPDAIASRTLAVLREGMHRVGATDVMPATDGTRAGLIAALDEVTDAPNNADAANITVAAVVMPIVTKVSQTQTVNSVAAQTYGDSGGRLYSFGSVHPADPDALAAVDAIAAAGLPGIKLHPEFQGFYIDSPESLAVLSRAAEHRLPVTVHAGRDIGMPPPVHCTPERILRVLDRLPDLTLIAAHLGGWMMWDEVAVTLCGAPLYFDTAFISRYLEPSRARDIILSHGAERVLFGSDCPWEHPRDTLLYLRSLGLSPDRLSAILGGNARRLLTGDGWRK